MLRRFLAPARGRDAARLTLAAALPLAIFLTSPPRTLFSQRSSGSGGIVISAEGIAALPAPRPLARTATPPRRPDRQPCRLSLRQLSADIRSAGDRLPNPTTRLLCFDGLQRIELVPGRDVLFHGWRVKDGTQGGDDGLAEDCAARRLECLILLWRALRTHRSLSVSLEPAPRGVREFEQLVRAGRLERPRLRRAIGPQRIRFDGIAGDNRFAHLLLAADLRFKRIGLGLDAVPRSGLPSYLAWQRKTKTLESPRWWLSVTTVPPRCDDARRVWTLPKPVVVAHAADARTGDPLPARWAERFNACWPRVRELYPEFAEVEWVMDLAMAIAIVEQENWLRKAGLESPWNRLLTLEVPRIVAPRFAATEIAAVRKASHTTIAAGGISLAPFRGLDRSHSGSGEGREADPQSSFFGIPIRGRRIALVIDVSHSMLRETARGETLLAIARRECRRAIRRLPPETEFGLVVFAGRAVAWRSRFVPAAVDARDSATRWLLGVPTGEGTATFEALERAISCSPPPEELFLLTDGWPTAGRLTRPAEIVAAVRRLARKTGTRVHTVGIGCGAAQAEFLRGLAEGSRGTSRFVH